MKSSPPCFRSLVASIVMIVVCARLGAAPERRINILHLHADDLRADGVHALGNPVLQTPNIDTLVARGMTFTHCYTMGSMIGGVCLPSRTMLLTGKSWRRIPAPRDPKIDISQTLAKVISRAGYETFHVGKEFAEFMPGLKAFDTNLVADDMTPELRRGTSERTADATIKFLKERTGDAKPFYIYFAPPVPHDPRAAPREFHAMYSADKIPLPAAFLPQHPWDNGEMTVRDERLAPWPRTPENTKQQIADYYACITALDYHIGRVFDQLKAMGEWDNTIIIFTGDNGLSLGEHGLFGKQNVYEFGGMHVPCIIAGPGIPKGSSDALVYLMDLFPTFCDLVGAPVPAGAEGHTLVPIIEGKTSKIRDVLYTAYRDCQRAIRDDRWKLIRYPLVDRTQLFDLSVDPHELHNLADDPAQAGRVASMMEALQSEMKKYADPFPLKVAHPKPAEWSPPAPRAVAAQPKHDEP